MQTVTYSEAQENLKAVLDKVVADRAPVMITRQRGENVVLISASEWAGMEETLQVMVKAGETVKFEPGGTHVMAMDLADTVAPGSQAEVTVTFVGGDKVSFPADVRAAGDER